MFTTLFTSADVVASSLSGLAIMSLAAAIICFLGLSWSNERWRVPVALGGTACLVTAVYYAGAAGYWFDASEASAGVRFSAWYSVHPLQVVAVYFYARTQGPVPVGVFWRLGGAAILMVFGRWLGDAGFFDESLGAILAIGFWLYILGELYFGAIPDRIRAAARPIKLGYFWIRLISICQNLSEARAKRLAFGDRGLYQVIVTSTRIECSTLIHLLDLEQVLAWVTQTG